MALFCRRSLCQILKSTNISIGLYGYGSPPITVKNSPQFAFVYSSVVVNSPTDYALSPQLESPLQKCTYKRAYFGSYCMLKGENCMFFLKIYIFIYLEEKIILQYKLRLFLWESDIITEKILTLKKVNSSTKSPTKIKQEGICCFCWLIYSVEIS